MVFCQPTVKTQKLKLIFRNNKLGVYEVPRTQGKVEGWVYKVDINHQIIFRA